MEKNSKRKPDENDDLIKSPLKKVRGNVSSKSNVIKKKNDVGIKKRTSFVANPLKNKIESKKAKKNKENLVKKNILHVKIKNQIQKDIKMKEPETNGMEAKNAKTKDVKKGKAKEVKNKKIKNSNLEVVKDEVEQVAQNGKKNSTEENNSKKIKNDKKVQKDEGIEKNPKQKNKKAEDVEDAKENKKSKTDVDKKPKVTKKTTKESQETKKERNSKKDETKDKEVENIEKIQEAKPIKKIKKTAVKDKKTENIKEDKNNKKETKDKEVEDIEKIQEVKNVKKTGAGKTSKSKSKQNQVSDESNDEPDKKKPKSNEEAPKKVFKNQTESNLNEIDFACEKLNELGGKWNLKIACFNVGGIRACLNKGFMNYLNKEDADILAIQEVKCNKEKLPKEIQEIEKYKYIYWCPAKKDGYSGVGLFSKIEPISVTYGLNDPEHDSEGRLIIAEFEKFFLLNTYVPNSGRGLVTLEKRLRWNQKFLDYVNDLKLKKPIIICGDMNVAHKEIDLKNPKTNTKNAGFTPQEREGMTQFLSNGYVDVFRKFYPDKPDVYTFWSFMSNSRAKNVGWRLDYFITSEDLIPSICDMVIRKEVYGSDHCPLVLYLNI